MRSNFSQLNEVINPYLCSLATWNCLICSGFCAPTNQQAHEVWHCLLNFTRASLPCCHFQFSRPTLGQHQCPMQVECLKVSDLLLTVIFLTPKFVLGAPALSQISGVSSAPISGESFCTFFEPRWIVLYVLLHDWCLKYLFSLKTSNDQLAMGLYESFLTIKLSRWCSSVAAC